MAVVTSKRFPEVATAICRSDPVRPSDGEGFTLSQTAAKTVLQNKSAISWEREPDRTGMGVWVLISHEIVPPVRKRVFRLS